MSSPYSLYSINAEMTALRSMFEAAELSEAEESDVAKWLGELGEELEKKLDGCVCFIAEEEGFIRAARFEAKRLQEMADVHEKRIDDLRELMLKVFEDQHINRVQTAHGMVSVRVNPPSVEVFGDIEELPDNLVRIKKEPDKLAIKALLKGGEELSFARLIHSKSIRIK